MDSAGSGDSPAVARAPRPRAPGCSRARRVRGNGRTSSRRRVGRVPSARAGPAGGATEVQHRNDGSPEAPPLVLHPCRLPSCTAGRPSPALTVLLHFLQQPRGSCSRTASGATGPSSLYPRRPSRSWPPGPAAGQRRGSPACAHGTGTNLPAPCRFLHNSRLLRTWPLREDGARRRRQRGGGAPMSSPGPDAGLALVVCTKERKHAPPTRPAVPGRARLLQAR
jgi:hypothetical protein